MRTLLPDIGIPISTLNASTIAKFATDNRVRKIMTELIIPSCTVCPNEGVEGKEVLEKEIKVLFDTEDCILSISHYTGDGDKDHPCLYVKINYDDSDCNKKNLMMICIDDRREIESLKRYLEFVLDDIDRDNIYFAELNKERGLK